MSDDPPFEPPTITDEDVRWSSRLLKLPVSADIIIDLSKLLLRPLLITLTFGKANLLAVSGAPAQRTDKAYRRPVTGITSHPIYDSIRNDGVRCYLNHASLHSSPLWR